MRAFVAIAEDGLSAKHPHWLTAWTSGPGEPMPSSNLLRHLACLWYTHICIQAKHSYIELNKSDLKKKATGRPFVLKVAFNLGI